MKPTYLSKELQQARKIYAATELIKGRTFVSVAKELNVSSERIRQYMLTVFRTSRFSMLNLKHEDGKGFTLPEQRKHKDYHLKLISGVAKHWGVPVGGVAYVKPEGNNHNIL